MSKVPAKKLPLDSNRIVTGVVLTIFAFIILFPFWWMISTSFDKSAAVTMPFPPHIWPKDFSTKAYKVIFTNIPFVRYTINTLTVIVGIMLVSTASALLAGYSFSKLRFKGFPIFMMIAMSVLMIPQEVVMVPQYMLFSFFGLTDSYWAFWLPGVCYVFGTFFVKQYMDTIPDTIREAAMIDGANEWTIFSKVFLPLCGTVVATLAVLLFLYGWNDLLWPLLILRTQEKFTMQIGIAFASSTASAGGTGQPLPAVNMATAIISVLPVICVYLFLQRYIVSSIALSGIKQ